MKYVWELNPVAFSVFGFDVRWYGMAYILGFFIASVLGWSVAKKIKLKVSKPIFENLVFGAFFSGIIGARLGFFLFYEPNIFITDIFEIFKVWHGGMSIHGGIIGSIFYCFIFSKTKNISIWKIFDVLVVPLSLALVFGRMANFLNGELIGRPTDQTWGVIFPHIDELYRHPSQLYESAKNLFIFIILLFFIQKELWKKEGLLSTTFLMGYGILRFFIEFVREPNSLYYGLSMGQILCIFMIFGALGLILIKKFWKQKE